MDIIEMIYMNKYKKSKNLEEKALEINRYPLELEKREKTAIEISDLKLSAAGVREVSQTRLVSFSNSFALKSDGVGTKILIAEAMKIYDTIGIDAVAMSVNDVLCVGAKPLMLVDYLAENMEIPEIRKAIIQGVKKGCEIADTTLVGGETATLGEMINGYGDGYHFDLATACFGIVATKNNKPITGENITEGDAIIGLHSNGLHSNGYLWVRPMLLKEFNIKAPYSLDYNKTPTGKTLGEELLKPTLIYVEPVLKMIKELDIKGIAHITGGAYKIKLLRIAPNGISFVLDNIPEPPWIFDLIEKHANSNNEKLYETFNMGIGLCLIVSKDDKDIALKIARGCNYKADIIGYTKREEKSKVYIPSKNIVFSKVQ